MLSNPIALAAENCSNILICGCGGGYDVFSGLQLFFDLKAMGKEVFLANLAFTHLDGKSIIIF